MIEKIAKLKHFGIFNDFRWDSCPPFRKFNLIYGWNRSGKTTLSRIFSACERQSTDFAGYPLNGEFAIKVDSSTTITNGTVAACDISIRVFNRDFIEDNISFDPSDSCNPIVVIGAIAKTDKETLDKLQKARPILKKEAENAVDSRRNKKDIKNNFLTSLGREVANTLFDKTFNKTKVVKCINIIGIDKLAGKVISDDDRNKYESISRSKSKDTLPAIDKVEYDVKCGDESITDYHGLNKVIRGLLEQEIVAETLDRLKEHPELNSWVKQGYDLHKSHEEREKCLFCESPLPHDLLSNLSKHFSKDYDELQANITTMLGELPKLKPKQFASRDKELYPDLIAEFRKPLTTANNIVTQFNTWIDEVLVLLEKKQQRPLCDFTLATDAINFDGSINADVAKLNAVIEKHNNKVENHGVEVTKAKEILEQHLIAVAVAQQNYKQMDKHFAEAVEEDEKAQNALSKNTVSIQTLEHKSSNIGNAIQNINRQLEGFFGRKEIQLELDNSRKGYIIKRGGQIATNLSEGEKTAIAFSYFIVKTQERDFRIKEGVIFIDDPISSFDSNFIYHCFSLVKYHFKEAGQLFLATHNFEFFNLVKDWFCRKSSVDRLCAFHMIETFPENDKRNAALVELDDTLKKFKSEYHYLFYLLCRFAGKTSPKYEDFYTIGNIARRFLEIFVDFKVPRPGNLRDKVNDVVKDINLDEVVIQETDTDKVYKLIQEYSHGYDPTSMIVHRDKAEIKDAITIMLRIIKNADPKHYDILLNTQ